jgi:hypothetical protein
MSRAEFDPRYVKNPETLTPQARVLQQIVDNYNAITWSSEGTNYFHPIEQRGNVVPTLVTPRHGNDLATQVSNNSIFIGYFNPATGKYTTYPELVSSEDFGYLKRSARSQREFIIERFDHIGDLEDRRTDYDHPLVIGLHQEHNDFIRKSGLADRVPCEFNESRESQGTMHTNNSYLEIDDSTHCFLSLADKPTEPEDSPLSDYYIVFNAIGSCTEISGVKIRKKIRSINIAQRVTDENGQCGRFEFEPIGELVSEWQIDDLTNLVSNLPTTKLLFSLEDLEFSTSSVALLTPPRREAA